MNRQLKQYIKNYKSKLSKQRNRSTYNWLYKNIIEPKKMLYVPYAKIEGTNKSLTAIALDHISLLQIFRGK